MRYKLNLPDNSFLIVDNDFEITIYKGLFSKAVRTTIKDILPTYEKYYLVELYPHKHKVKFNLEETDLDLPIGKRFKFSQHMKIGDLVIGENGQPIRVKEIHTGESEMFEITIEDKSYVVNSDHILHLVDRDTGEVLDMPVNIYVLMDDEFKSHYTMEQLVIE